MKASKNDQQGDAGLYFVANKVTQDFDWIFRPQPHRDLGIDAIIEIKENNETKGQLLALQIKSGASWFSEVEDKSIVFRANDDHIQYWNDFPIPVLVVLHEPKSNQVYWQIVNKNTSISTGKNWKIHIPYAQLFTNENKQEIKKYCDFLLPASYFDIISFKDVSHNTAKRYGARIILNRDLSKGEIVQIVRRATDELKTREYYRNKIVKESWQGKMTNAIWLFIYPSLEDEKNNNFICRSQWIDPELRKESRPLQLEGQNIGDDLIIDWSNYYKSVSEFFQQNKLSKEDFLNEIELVLQPILKISNDAIHCSRAYQNKSISDSEYIDKMEKIAPKINDLYMKGTDIGLTPLECKDFGQKFQSLIACADNIALPFSERGKEVWKKDSRDILITNSIKHYLEVLAELQYEYKKLH